MQVKYNTSAHSVYTINLHLVFVTKYRRKALSEEVLAYMNPVFEKALENWDCELIEFGGEADHIHLLVAIHPALDISKLVNNLKSVSSRKTRKRFAEHLRQFYWKPVLWTGAYFVASAGGAPLSVIKQYVEQQGRFA